jgi:hypothetical protein
MASGSRRRGDKEGIVEFSTEGLPDDLAFFRGQPSDRSQDDLERFGVVVIHTQRVAQRAFDVGYPGVAEFAEPGRERKSVDREGANLVTQGDDINGRAAVRWLLGDLCCGDLDTEPL